MRVGVVGVGPVKVRVGVVVVMVVRLAGHPALLVEGREAGGGGHGRQVVMVG